MTKFRVYETLDLVHYIEAASVEEAKTKLEKHGPLSPPPEFDTEILRAETTTVVEADGP